MKKSLRLGEILLKENLISEEQLREALSIQKVNKNRLGDILVEKGYISDKALGEIMAREFHIEFVDLQKEKIDETAAKLISFELLKKHRVFPLRVEEGYLLLAVSDPLDLSSVQEISHYSSYSIKLVIATPKQIDDFIKRYSGTMRHMADIIQDIVTKKKGPALIEATEMSLKELEAAAGKAPVVRLVNYIIAEAITERASDIHFEPQENELFVRFRIDGILYNKVSVPKNLQPQVISRVKIMSGMDIAERRKPQDGRMSLSAEGRDFDVRVSTLPGIFGEKIVLRLLDKQSILIPLESLGMDEEELFVVKRLIRKPCGIILMTGPTGAGKTTTLYSMLNALNEASRNIVTVEDPVEYELPRVNQTSINVRAGYTFATAIRHILRQDPDIIMVGEIRDLETVEVAIQAALTGHLVLSTLHTNSAPGAVTRLLDMNAEPFLVSSALIGVISQRLVRKLCPFCMQEYTAPENLKEGILRGQKETTLARAVGCDKCGKIGYSGRTGIFEILSISEEMQKLILKKPDESKLAKAAALEGMKSLRDSGIKRALAKITSLEEVMRVTFTEKDK
ncbi:MAG: ATPase, T2SS/T4P/T4SS family [Candidatus Omnitrophica bacterium]|nr:ATPase, T2SS/T4P/T4SS family [Candidatus Omnitrophota bacterium]